jgi:hypothetical protein
VVRKSYPIGIIIVYGRGGFIMIFLGFIMIFPWHSPGPGFFVSIVPFPPPNINK